MKGSLQFTELDGRFKGNEVFKWMVTITHNGKIGAQEI